MATLDVVSSFLLKSSCTKLYVVGTHKHSPLRLHRLVDSFQATVHPGTAAVNAKQSSSGFRTTGHRAMCHRVLYRQCKPLTAV